MDLRSQKRMAAQILKCGINRVWINPDKIEDLEDAITRSDIRTAIQSGTIAKLPARGISRGRKRRVRHQQKKGRRRGQGTRKGGLRARLPKKDAWIKTIRPIRMRLREMKDQGRLDKKTYRELYMQAKGGMFKNRAHLEQQLRAAGYLREADK